MKIGKEHIHNLPMNDVTSLGAYAQRLELEAQAKGIVLPPAVRLQIGEPSFRTPDHIRQAAIEAVAHEPMIYGPAGGWPWLRELLAAKVQRVNGYTIQPNNTAIAVGGTGAVLVAMLATLNPGDEVLIPDPCWPMYFMQLATSGVVGVPYPLDPYNEWLPDTSSLEKLVTPRTRMVIINTPGNPTGSVFPAQSVHEMLEFARRHDLYLLSDECYDEIVFEGSHVSPATMLSYDELESGRFIGIYTFSKSYAMTGWRIGYLVSSTALIETIINVLNASYTNMATMIQRAAAAALTGPQDCVATMRDTYKRRRDLAVALLKDYGRYIYTPHGAFYALIDVRGKQVSRGRQFALDLLHERNVAVAPGSGFGSVSQDYVRISLAASAEEVERGVREVCEFADR